MTIKMDDVMQRWVGYTESESIFRNAESVSKQFLLKLGKIFLLKLGQISKKEQTCQLPEYVVWTWEQCKMR